MDNKRRALGRRSQAESARTRRRILDRAEKLFARRGYRGVSLREIAAGAGVRPNTIQHHFGSKAGLYESVLTRWNDEVRKRVSNAVNEGATLSEVVESVIDALFDFFLTKRDWVAVTARAALGEGLPKGLALGERGWVGFIGDTTRGGGFDLPKLDLGLLMISIEGLLNNHILASAHYRQLYGRDVTDPSVKARTKKHLQAAIMALMRAET